MLALARSARNRVAFLAAGTVLAVGTVALVHNPAAEPVAASSVGPVATPTDLAGVMAMVADASTLAGGSGNLFLKIDGIPGESFQKGHEGQIEIGDYSWGVTNSSNVATKTGTAKPEFSEFTFSKYTDKASPALMLRTANGQHIPTVTLTAVEMTGGEAAQTYLTIVLSDVLVSSYQQRGGEDGSATEDLKVKFSKITFEYKPQNANGSLGTAVRAGWDLKANKAV